MTKPKRKQSAAASTHPVAANVLAYVKRFRGGEEKGKNALGGGSQTKTDRQIHEALIGALVVDEEACRHLREFICAYGVARTFAGLSKDSVQRLSPIITHLKERRRDASIVEQVDALADATQAAGFHRNLMAAPLRLPSSKGFSESILFST